MGWISGPWDDPEPYRGLYRHEVLGPSLPPDSKVIRSNPTVGAYRPLHYHSQVYLAGPIAGLSWTATKTWRAEARDELAKYGILGLDPLRGKEYLADMAEMPMEADYALSTAHAITVRDRWDCTRSDAVLVNLIGADKVSIGTVMEIAWADSVRHPSIVAMEPGNVHDHPMIREAAGIVVPTLEEALSIIVGLLRR